jgi:hypothetical protein
MAKPDRAQEALAEVMLGLRQSIAAAANQIAASLPTLLEYAEHWQADSEEVLRLISKRGWLVSRRMMPKFTSQMLTLYRGGGMEAVEAELLAEYDDEFCSQLINGLRPDLFSQWQPVLTKAIGAHLRGEFALAIPIWLITAEGVIAKWQSDPNVYRRLTPGSIKGWLGDALGDQGDSAQPLGREPGGCPFGPASPLGARR